MALLKKFLVVFLVTSALYLTACTCGCEKSEENTIKGVITVIGNEPFTKLAIKADDGKYYVLMSSKELNSELNKKQGSYYLIQYGDKRTEENNEVLIVEKAIPVKNDSK